MKTILIWDIENVSIKYLDVINKNLKFLPDVSFAISKKNLSKKTKNLLAKNNIKHIQSKRIADDFILDLLKITQETKDNFIIISSDSDFCSFFKKIDDFKKVQWFVSDLQKKRILMKNNIVSNKISYFVLDFIPTAKKEIKIKSFSKQKIKKKSLSGKTSKLTLDELEMLSFSTNKEKEVSKFLEMELLKYKQHILERTSISFCNSCGNHSPTRNGFCYDCERKFVIEFSKDKSFSHQEKMEFFLQQTEKEIKNTGFVIYTDEILSFDLIEENLRVRKNHLLKSLPKHLR